MNPSPIPASALLPRGWGYNNLVTPDLEYVYAAEFLTELDGLTPALTRQALEQLEKLGHRVGTARGNYRLTHLERWQQVELDGLGCAIVFPRVLDASPGATRRPRRGGAAGGGFSMAEAIGSSFHHHEQSAGSQFTLEPLVYLELESSMGFVPAACYRLPEGAKPLRFFRGLAGVQVALTKGAPGYAAAGDTARLLTEVVAGLVFLYDNSAQRGLVDLSLNEDLLLCPDVPDAAPRVRFAALRRFQEGVTEEHLLGYLLRLVAFECAENEDCDRVPSLPLPTLLSSPSVVFEGLRLGLRHRVAGELKQLHTNDDVLVEAERLLREWLTRFSSTRIGRAYGDHIALFLRGQLPLSFALTDPWEGRADLFVMRKLLDLADAKLTHLEAELTTTERRYLLAAREELNSRVRQLTGPPAVIELSAQEVDRLGQGAFEELAQLHAGFGLHGRIEPRSSTVEEPEPGSSPDLSVHELVLRQPGGRSIQNLARSCLSFREYMDLNLHDPDWGFYARRARIESEGHFTTYPVVMSPYFGRWVAAAGYRTFVELREQGELARGDVFHMVEFGAGTGQLAKDVLDQARMLDPTEQPGTPDRLTEFLEVLAYVIVERSAHLRQVQAETTRGQCVVIIEGDARAPEAALDQIAPNGLKGVIFSNELLDAFGVHKVRLRDAQLQAACVIPIVELTALEQLFDSSEQLLALEKAHRQIGAELLPGMLEELSGQYLLDRAGYQAVMHALSARDSGALSFAATEALQFRELYLPAQLFPALAASVGRHAALMAGAFAESDCPGTAFVNPDADSYQVAVANTLSAGAVITVDYGATTTELVNYSRYEICRFRSYGLTTEEVPGPNSAYDSPGGVDMTTDQDFAALAATGEAAGLRTLHFGPQVTLAGPELATLLREEPFDPESDLGDFVCPLEGFAVLVQGRGLVKAPVMGQALNTDIASGEQLGPAAKGLETLLLAQMSHT